MRLLQEIQAHKHLHYYTQLSHNKLQEAQGYLQKYYQVSYLLYHLPNQNTTLNNNKKSQHYCYVSAIRITVILHIYHSRFLALTFRHDIRPLLSGYSQHTHKKKKLYLCHQLSSPKLKAFHQIGKSSRLQAIT